MRIGQHRHKVGNVRRMRVLCAGLQQAGLLVRAHRLRILDDLAFLAARVRLDALHAQAIVDQRHDDVADDRLRAAGQFAVVARTLADLQDH